MQLIAFNGSPRKTSNTATLLDKAIAGAAAAGASTRLVHLYDLKFQGCRSCFGCKTKGGPSHGRCAMKDDLTPLLDEVRQADALLFGSPIYFWGMTGEMKSFLERLMFPFYRYVPETDPAGSLFPRKIRTGFIYTCNAPEERLKSIGFERTAGTTAYFLERIFGAAETIFATDTYPWDDFSKIDQQRFDPARKAARREEHWPGECRCAYEFGARLVAQS
jgi:multimeric flavodoxin WrbA